MCSGNFQRALLHITCLCLCHNFAATLTKTKHVGNAFNYLKRLNGLQTTYGYDVIFLCCMLIKEMIILHR